MKVRSLKEAAAEVLNASRNAGKEPTKSLSPESIQGAIVDLGGSTLDNPQGNDDIGKRAAAVAPVSFPGKTAGEPTKKIDKDTGKTNDKNGAVVEPSTINSKASGPDVPLKTESEEVEGEVLETTDEASDEVVEEEVELTAEEVEAARQEKLTLMREKMKTISVKEDIDAIFNGQDLSEEFKTNVATIFETAVIAKAMLVVEELEKDILQAAEQTVATVKEELEEQIDSYLNYMVEEWVNENKVAIESGLKAELVEDFINGLKNLFTEHYVDLPSEKVDVVESLQSDVEELTTKLNESLNSNIELAKRLNEASKKEILSSVCEGLTATQASKVKTLAEGVEFTTEGEYANKLKVIRESYFSKDSAGSSKPVSAIALSEQEAHVEPEVKVVSPEVAAIAAALGRTQRK